MAVSLGGLALMCPGPYLFCFFPSSSSTLLCECSDVNMRSRGLRSAFQKVCRIAARCRPTGLILGATPLSPWPFSFAPVQGKDARLAFAPAPGGLPDVWTLPIDLTDPEHPKPGKPEPFLADPAIVEVDPSFSPDVSSWHIPPANLVRSKFSASRSLVPVGSGKCRPRG